MASYPSAGRARLTSARRWWRGQDRVVAALVAISVLLKLVAVSTARPALYPDTPTYRVPGGFLDFSLVSLDGRSMRPWGVTAFMALWPSDEAIVFAQALLSAVAWGALAFSVAASIRPVLARRLIVAVLLVLGLTAQVAGWDLTLTCESVSVSTGILALAALLSFTRRRTWGRALLFAACALWFSMTRPNVFPTLLAWAAALLLVALVRRRDVLVQVVVAAALVGFSLYAYVYNVRSDPTWQATWGASRTAIAYGYPISENDPVAQQVIRDIRASDAPRCMVPSTPSEVSGHGTTQWVVEHVRACPEMESWLRAHWSTWWASWLVHHPRAAATIVHKQLPYSLSPPVYASVMTPVPTAVASLYFSSPALPQDAYTTQIPHLPSGSRTYQAEPVLLWLAAAALLAWVSRKRWRGSAWASDVVTLGGAVGAVGSAVSSGLLIQTAPFEVSRESAGVAVLLAASCVVLVGLALDRSLGPVAVEGQPRREARGRAPDEPDPRPGTAVSPEVPSSPARDRDHATAELGAGPESS